MKIKFSSDLSNIESYGFFIRLLPAVNVFIQYQLVDVEIGWLFWTIDIWFGKDIENVAL